MLRPVTAAIVSLFLVLTAFAADPADPLIAQGVAAMAAGDHDKAIQLLKLAVAKSPRNASAHYHLGEAYGDAAQSAGIFSQASLAGKCRDEFESAVALDPNHLDARSSLLEFYVMAPGIIGGSETKALQQAQEIRKRDSLRGHLAFVQIYEDRYIEAERVARRVLEPTPMNTPPEVIAAAHLTWAAALVGQRKTAAAEEKLAKSVAIYAYSSSAYEFWAQIKESQHDPAAAERMRSKAIENALYFENYGELAVLYFEVAWRDGQKLERNKYGNPAYLTLMENDK